MNEVLQELASTVVRTFPIAPNRGDLTVREAIDAHMAGYAGAEA